MPWLIGFFCLAVGPIVASLYLSFTDYDAVQAPQWIGLENYEFMFQYDKRFWKALSVTFTFVLISVPAKLIFALAVAMVLDKGVRAIGWYRALFYLPSILGGSIAVAILWRQLFESDGVINTMLAIIGIDGPNWLSDPRYSLTTIIVLAIWQFGSPMLIFLAGLRAIPQELYEAAEIDAAGKLRRFFAITLPLLAPVIFFNLVLQMIEAFKSFSGAFVISGGKGAPLDSLLFYHGLSLQRGLLVLPHGLRLGARLGAAPHHRGLHRHRVLDLASTGSTTRTRGADDGRRRSQRQPRIPPPPRSPRRSARSAPSAASARRFLKHIFLIITSLIMIYPLIWMLASSLKPDNQIFGNLGLWPSEFALGELHRRLERHGGQLHALLPQLDLRHRALGDRQRHLLLVRGLCLRAARVHRQDLWFALMMMTLMIPYHVVLIPQYILFLKLGWVDTYLPLIVPRFLAGDAFFIFLMVQFFRQLPRELDEAAMIDGCSPFKIYWAIIMPLSIPAMATAAIFSFIWTWEDFLGPLVYLNDMRDYTVPLRSACSSRRTASRPMASSSPCRSCRSCRSSCSSSSSSGSSSAASR